MQARELVERLAREADIRINGDRPWDIQVHNEALYSRVLRQGTLGLGEAYMDGWWDCEEMDAMFCRAIRAHLERALCRTLPFWMTEAAHALFNLQSRARAFMVARAHYDTDPALFRAMLGPTMQYSCAFWQKENGSAGEGLDEAQRAKMDMICRKLSLEPGMTVLDIGCGWGALALHMAEEYGVHVTGITVSREQLAFAQDKAASSGVEVEYRLMDYRSLRGAWDRVVSVGMFEHVGRRNYGDFMDTVRNALKPGGLFLLHSIGSNGALGAGSGADPWLTRYIFPNGILPSPSTLVGALERDFVMEDWQNFGADYDKTLMAWYENFERGFHAGAFSCTARQRRMYHYYLLSCAGAFRARSIQVWQLVLSPEGLPGGYCRKASDRL
ncbi:cyclopropane fatty acyl phospholipid synthase [Mailhella massiliensis]|uniref:Cyclopropane fatty acyl phospholipid synthase n=1 Tax=Mailhella massiliensis TaxID=1903261 RepID=A0A921DRD6_9BACT|nr:cyclopropane fatty acyl phospholipid synthase [Mailhella massiliensis]HJD97580.1 cyclopropane fatty acyl phospholipid synthase [Mailhella massiliensis]